AGAFMMIPKKIMDEVQGFDEDFFMYGEDIDLSYRIQKAGYHNYYFGESSIIHFKGESTKKMSINYVKMFYNAMSIFSKKHHGGAKAGFYHAFIQSAIWLRAFFSAGSRFLKWIGLPIIDIIIILLSFALAKNLWEAHLHYELNYSINLIIIAFPVFTFLFITSSYFSGLYDNGFKQSYLNKSAVTAILVILSVYAILPERFQFSRVVLLAASVIAFVFMSAIRQILIKWKIIRKAIDKKSDTSTYIIGTKGEYNKIYALFKCNQNKNRILERFSLDKMDADNMHNSFRLFLKDLPRYIQKEIIFCEGALSFKTIISLLPLVPHQFEVKFFARGNNTIIGSDDKDLAGEYIANEKNFRLSNPMARRNKRSIDVIISLFFIFTFPIHFLFKKRPFLFLKNCFNVLFHQQTWVGYASNENWLPPLKPGVITTNGISVNHNQPISQSLISIDKNYVQLYTMWEDVKLITLHYSNLS
ncbi:MAG: glycosyltransferase family 2 protein, partial [Ginsengibacter sp.]